MNSEQFDELYHRAWRSDSPELVPQVTKAMADLQHIETPKVPEPSQAQQLLWVTQRCAELSSRLNRKNHLLAEAIMWLSVDEPARAQEAMNKAILHL